MRLNWKWTLGLGLASAVAAGFGAPSALTAQQPAAPQVTYTKDIAPILQRSCENCHRPGGGGPMPLTSYEEVRPWARAIKTRTGIGPHAGVMPPWYMEKNIGIQKDKDDPSLSAEEVAKVAAWADSGAPRGNPADMPPPKQYADANTWRIGTPDFIVKTKNILVKANSPDWWGEIEPVPIPLDEDRYVLAVEIKEVNDATVHNGGRDTVGGLFVWHHLIYRTQPGADYQPTDIEAVAGSENVVNWPVHEVGRNPDYFYSKSAVLLKKGSWIFSDSLHTHSSGKDVTSHLEFGYKLAPKGYTPTYKRAVFGLGNGVDIDIAGLKKDQLLHAYTVLNEPTKIISFEPHLHAPGNRMCLEAIWGYNIQTLSCVGYDHNWVRGYSYSDDVAPLLPKGTILHIIGYFDNTPGNKNVPDPRNWSGSGNRSITNMFIDLGNRVSLTEEQFQEEMRARVSSNPDKDVILGCPLCGVVAQQMKAAPRPTQNQGQQQ
ncbi:MAG: cytochrome c [Vicinamibacterales bacterium]